MTLEEMKKRKIELGLTNEMIAEKSGVPLSTVQKLFCGMTKAPRKATIDALERLLSQKSAVPDTALENDASSSAYSVREDAHSLRDAGPAYSAQKQSFYTVEDYYRLPDDKRAELIDGTFYDLAAPSLRHQLLIGELYMQFRECIKKQGSSCRVFLSPSDVRLDRDDRTMLQPDLYIVCGDFDPEARAFDGAPDLTVEILSSSTRSKDMLLKLNKYHDAGVREYWIVDPEYRLVTVYDFTNRSLYPVQYDFESIVPVAISGGKCRIDFGEISRTAFTNETDT